jgi:radical SAM protein with 4Fe4S-binding SPASM domain
VNAVHLVPYVALRNEHESLFHDKARCNRMLDQARETARKHAITFCEPGSFDVDPRVIPVDRLRRTNARGHDIHVGSGEAPSRCCPFPWHFVAIDGSGDVRPCGWWHNEPPLGNILRQSFNEIWEGEGFRRIRQEHIDGTLRGVCRQCPAAGLGSVDDELAFVAREP